MKSNSSANKARGSNPSLSAKIINKHRQHSRYDVRQTMAIISVQSPGGDNEEIMKQQLVKLHTTGKRWYVSYYFTDHTGKRIRKRVYDYVNAESNPEKRLKLLFELQNKVYNSLRNQEHYSDKKLSGLPSNIFKITSEVQVEKKAYLKTTAYLAVRKNLKAWKQYLLETNLATVMPNAITRVDVINYRNWLLLKGLSNRTVNNYMDELKTLFNYIIEKRENLLDRNPMRNIDSLPYQSEVHVAYSDQEMKLIFNYLQENDPYLLFFIKFVAYTFLRPNEVRMLQIKHFDLPLKKITLTAGNAKVNRRTTKLIPDIFIGDILGAELHKFPKEYYLFGLQQKPQAQPVNEKYFTKRYSHIKKVFSLSPLHTIYGFRHTTVSQLLRAGKSWDDVMKLTGHTSMASFQKYARSIMGAAPKDLSDGFAKMF